MLYNLKDTLSYFNSFLFFSTATQLDIRILKYSFFSIAEFGLNDCMDLLHGFAQEKGIEFDGYFQERWEVAADTIVNFDEDYFENRDRKNLYVFLSALYDDEVFDYLQNAYAIAKLEAPTKEWVKL